jgi:hypothetical protein
VTLPADVTAMLGRSDGPSSKKDRLWTDFSCPSTTVDYRIALLSDCTALLLDILFG